MYDSPSNAQSAARIIRAAATTWWLTVQIASDIASGAHDEWCQRQTRAAAGRLLRRLVMLCRYHLAGAVGRRAFLQFSGWGTRPGNVDRGAQHRQRSLLADRRRRHVMVLLRSLGANADEVEATLTRHWQLTAQDDWIIPLIPDFLATRLRWRDPVAGNEIDILRWACNIGGVWLPTPAPVRRYLSRADQHERQLSDAYSRHSRRGVRPSTH